MTRFILFNAVCLFTILCLVQAVIFYEDLDNDVPGIDKLSTHIFCRCEHEVLEEKFLDELTVKKFFEEIMYFGDYANKIEKYPDIKEQVKGCMWCEFGFTDCFGNTSDHTCLRRTVRFVVDENYRQNKNLLNISYTTTNYGMTNDNVSANLLTNPPHAMKNNVSTSLLTYPPYAMKTEEQLATDLSRLLHHAVESEINRTQANEDQPDVIEISKGGHMRNHRMKRSLQATSELCAVPEFLKTADIKCLKYPSKTTCVQRCAQGYTLATGIHREMECKLADNAWLPTGFQECQPYVDCTLTLMSGGSMTCKSANLERGTECKVECLHFEDQPYVPNTVYTCSVDGSWDPPLPFCVMTGSGLALVKAPKVKFHDAVESRKLY